MANSALGPVSVAVFGRLNVQALKGAYPGTGAGCTGGVFDSAGPPQAASYPRLWYWLAPARVGHLGRGDALYEFDMRLYVESTYGGMAEAARISSAAIGLLANTEPPCDGYRIYEIEPPNEEIPVPAYDINGVKIVELVTNWRFHVEQVAV